MRISIKVVLAIGCVIGLVMSQAQATLWTIEKDWTLYGNLNQRDIPAIGNFACGPAAAVNSFVYLENAYGGIYDNSLTPEQGLDRNGDNVVDYYDDMIAAAEDLAYNYMNTQAAHGTWHDDFIWGKYQYIENMVPGMTVYEAQDYWDWTNHALPDWVDPVIPTWRFMYDELVACEDVEILINGVDEDLGHYLTLTSFFWDDATNAGTMDYIDPWTGAWGICNIWQDTATGRILTDYWDAGSNVSWVSMAVSESPIPEPSTLILLLSSGLIGIICYRRKRSG